MFWVLSVIVAIASATASLADNSTKVPSERCFVQALFQDLEVLLAREANRFRIGLRSLNFAIEGLEDDDNLQDLVLRYDLLFCNLNNFLQRNLELFLLKELGSLVGSPKRSHAEVWTKLQERCRDERRHQRDGFLQLEQSSCLVQGKQLGHKIIYLDNIGILKC